MSTRNEDGPVTTVRPDALEPSSGDPDPGSGFGWHAAVWVVATVYAVVTLLRAWQIGIPIKDPVGHFFLDRIAISLVFFVVLVPVDAVIRAWRVGRSLRVAPRIARERLGPRRLVPVMSGLVAYYVVYLCYHNWKSWDVFNRPRDSMLAEWDTWLFLGHSPAVLLHNLLGGHVAAQVLTMVYESFSWLAAGALVAALVFPNRARDSYVFLAAAQWVWIVGVASYYLVPSLGPFQYAPHDFAGLVDPSIKDTQTKYLMQREHLLAHPHAGDAFAQISAFASLHVAVTFLILLMARYYGLRRITLALAAYLAATVVATIYLGWHYAVDDVAGLLIGLAAAALGRLTIYPGEWRTPLARSRSSEASARAATSRSNSSM